MTRRAPSKRFIDVPAVDLLAEINAIGAAVVAKGGQLVELGKDREHGREIRFALRPPRSRAEVRIYTSVARGQAQARGCGDDAIRLFWGFWDGEPGRSTAAVDVATGSKFKPLCKAVRVFRTAPAGEPEARLAAFLGRFRAAVRAVYKAAVAAPSCPRCSAPMVERSSQHSVFWGCAAYPRCTGTRPWRQTVVIDSLTHVTETGRRVRNEPKLRNMGRTPRVSYRETINSSAQDSAAHGNPLPPHFEGLSGHELVALYGMPHGEMAAEQVQAGLDAEADADPLGHVIYEGGSALAQALIRGDRRRRGPF